MFENHGPTVLPSTTLGMVLEEMGYQVLGLRKRLLGFELVPVAEAAGLRFADYVAIPN